MSQSDFINALINFNVHLKLKQTFYLCLSIKAKKSTPIKSLFDVSGIRFVGGEAKVGNAEIQFRKQI